MHCLYNWEHYRKIYGTLPSRNHTEEDSPDSEQLSGVWPVGDLRNLWYAVQTPTILQIGHEMARGDIVCGVLPYFHISDTSADYLNSEK